MNQDTHDQDPHDQDTHDQDSHDEVNITADVRAAINQVYYPINIDVHSYDGNANTYVYDPNNNVTYIHYSLPEGLEGEKCGKIRFNGRQIYPLTCNIVGENKTFTVQNSADWINHMSKIGVIRGSNSKILDKLAIIVEDVSSVLNKIFHPLEVKVWTKAERNAFLIYYDPPFHLKDRYGYIAERHDIVVVKPPLSYPLTCGGPFIVQNADDWINHAPKFVHLYDRYVEIMQKIASAKN